MTDDHYATLEQRDLPGDGPRVQVHRAVCSTCTWASAWMVKARALEAGTAHSATKS